MTGGADVRAAGERFVTRRDGIELWHSFSFGEHYDPDNVSFGLLLASNEMVLAPGTGFEMHEHREIEVVTWVVRGSLQHQDSRGHVGLISPGAVQRMSAGSGILHSEKTSGPEPVRAVQMWIAPDEPGIEPSYEQCDLNDALAAGALVAVASGRPGNAAAVRIHQPDAVLYAARLDGTSVRLPPAPYLHLQVTRGSVTVDGVGSLSAGDAVRMRDSYGQRVAARGAAEVLVWAMRRQMDG
jgi:quercetin 2,3-dioxygenase